MFVDKLMIFNVIIVYILVEVMIYVSLVGKMWENWDG